MKKNLFKRYLLLTPILVLLMTLFFLNYTVQYFKDTAHRFVFNTNVQSVQRFSRELKALASEGYDSRDYEGLYTDMIINYNVTMGEKDAIVTFMMDDNGQILHSSGHNRTYLTDILQHEENKVAINDAFQSRSEGTITLQRNNTEETFYYRWFYSGSYDYTLYMCVERQVIDKQLNANGVSIPISIIGLLLLLTMEYIIWLKMNCEIDKATLEAACNANPDTDKTDSGTDKARDNYGD